MLATNSNSLVLVPVLPKNYNSLILLYSKKNGMTRSFISNMIKVLGDAKSQKDY